MSYIVYLYVFFCTQQSRDDPNECIIYIIYNEKMHKRTKEMVKQVIAWLRLF